MLRKFCLVISLLVSATAHADYLTRPFADDIVYFLVLDRFAKQPGDGAGLPALDPTNPRMFHGGNLRAAAGQLDYIKGLGATAIWMTPIFVNQALSEDHGKYPQSAGYHGYWILNFLAVDPHFGSEDDLKFFIAEAHKRDIKVIFDIVVNHTADVIRYRECPNSLCPYRSRAAFPYGRRAADGAAINQGFLGDAAEQQNPENFARLTEMSYAYTPYIPAGREHAKTPDWLNDLRFYHNRGASTFKGESATHGDFGGLDDVYTENPRVLQGFVEIYRYWIEKFHIDGYRIDTARHVNVEFWQSFNPQIIDFARKQGIANFTIFGEVADFSNDSVMLARFTRTAKFPGSLDFAFYDLVTRILSGQEDDSAFAKIFQADDLYEDGSVGAARQPTFISNHDDGRLAYRLRKQNPAMPAEQLMARVRLGHALLMFARGVPILYYGDEQGFIGTGDDNLARQDMFATEVAAFRDEDMLGPVALRQGAHFHPEHPLYRAIAAMAALRNQNEVLRRGDFRLRGSSATPGLIAFSRLDVASGDEWLIAVNLANQPSDAAIEVDPRSLHWSSAIGACQPGVIAPASYAVAVPALDYVVCHHKP